MTSQNQTLDSYVQSLAIMWTGLFTGPLLFGMISYFLRVSGQFSYVTTAEFSNIMIYLVPAVMIGALLAGNFLYKNRLSAIKKMATRDEKLTAYRSVFIIRNAMPEMAAFLAVVAYLLTGDLRFLAGAAVMLIWLIAIFPKRGRLVTELEL